MHKKQWSWRKDKLALNLSAVCVRTSLQHGLPWVWASPCSGTELQGLQEGLCSGTWRNSCPSCTDLGDCRAIPLTYSHSSLQLPLHWSFFPFLTLLFTTADRLSPGQLRVPLGAAGIGSIADGGNFWQLFTEATPVALQSTKTLPCNLHTVVKTILFKINWQFYW